jgi:hypothetical protein
VTSGRRYFMGQGILPATYFTLLRLALLWCLLVAVGCQWSTPSTKPDPGSLQREAEMLRKQNEEMVKKR